MTSSSRTVSRGIISVLALVTAAGVGACGAAAPPQQLKDARAAYSAAASGPAAKLTPAELVDAKKALDKAEQNFAEDGASDKTIDAAYIAQRRAQIADARGRLADAQAEKEHASAKLARLNEERMRAMQRQLGEARGEVSRTQERLQVKGHELEEAQKARAAAEARMKDAMDKLALAAALQVKEEPRGTVITLPGSVMFASGKWQLLPGAKGKLDAVAASLKDQPDVTITIEGHTDSRGSTESNMELSKKRAESVLAYLESKGVPKDQLTAEGVGEARPIADNDTAAGRAMNRRVEIIVKPREPR